MKTRIIYTKIWEDEFFTELNPTEKLLFVYYITNSRIGLTGMYELTDRVTAFETGLSTTQIQTSKTKFQKANKIIFKDSWVYVLNSSRLGGYSGAKLEKAIEKENSLIPEEIYSFFIKGKYLIDSVSGISDTPINHKSEIINHKLENTMDYLKDFPIEDFADIDGTEKQIRLEGEKALNNLLAKGKTKKNYKAYLRNWILGPYCTLKKKNPSVIPEFIPDDQFTIDEHGIAKVKAMKAKFNLN